MNTKKLIKSICTLGLVLFCGFAWAMETSKKPTAQEKKLIELEKWDKPKLINIYKECVAGSSLADEKKEQYNNGFYEKLDDKDVKGMMHQFRSVGFLCALSDRMVSSFEKYNKVIKQTGYFCWATGVGALVSSLLACGKTLQRGLLLKVAAGCAVGCLGAYILKSCLNHDLVENTFEYYGDREEMFGGKPLPQTMRSLVSKLFWYIPGDLNLPEYVICSNLYDSNRTGGSVRNIIKDIDSGDTYIEPLIALAKNKISPIRFFRRSNNNYREERFCGGGGSSGLNSPGESISEEQKTKQLTSLQPFYNEAEEKLIPFMIAIAKKDRDISKELFLDTLNKRIDNDDDQKIL